MKTYMQAIRVVELIDVLLSRELAILRQDSIPGHLLARDRLFYFIVALPIPLGQQ